MIARRKSAAPAARLRTRAEKLLAQAPREIAGMPVEDVQKLVHELQVHQIELEMQNEELRRTQLELEAVRERLLLPYDAAPVGFLSLDAKGDICEANLAAARLLNFDRVKLAGQKLTRFIAPESQDTFYLHRRQLASTGEKQTCELRLLRTGGGSVIARLETVLERTAPGPAARYLVVMSDITERQRAREALRQSEARLATFASATFEGIIESEAGRILDCNEQFARMLGYAPAALKGMEVAALIAPEDRDRVLPGIQEGREQVIELAMLRQDGTRIMVEAHGQPVPPGGGRRHTAVRDISDRKRAEQALQQTHAELEQRVRERTRQLDLANLALRGEKEFSDSLIELAPAIIAVVDQEGNLIRTNAYAEQLTGYSFAETRGRNMISLFVPRPEQPRVYRLLREALQGRLGRQVVAPLRTRGGGLRHIEWFSKALPNAEGKLTALLAVGHDITERKQVEEALRRSEHHLSDFFHQAPIGLVWLSASGAILRANQAHLDLMGYAAEEYEGCSFLEFCAEPAPARELLERLAARETVRNLRLAQRRKDGAVRHLLVDAISLWRGKQLEYSSIFLRDITDRLHLEQEILHISEREHQRIAQDLHDGLGQLLVGAAYLAGTVRQDLAAKSLPEARELRRIWEVINEAGDLTRNLARGLHPVEPVPNGLMVALEALAARTNRLFRVRCLFLCRRPVLLKDNTVATHLFRIAQEAVTNAIKHGKPERIKISLTAGSDRLKLEVADDGSGMPARQRKQAGIGLRIMLHRAGMIGGSLATQPAVGGGTSIVCTVRLSAAAVPKSSPGTARERSERKEASWQNV